jgi:glycosyltransferase involved in cell wall biosynthesis
MNVGLLVETLVVGGAQTLVVREAKWLQAHGHHAVVFSAGGALEDELQAAGIPHITIPSFDPGKPFTPEQLFEDGGLFKAAVEKQNLDVLVGQAQWPFVFAAIAAAGSNVRVVLHVLSSEYWIPPTPRAVAALLDAVNDGRVVSSSLAHALAFGKKYGFDPRRIHIQNLPIEPNLPQHSSRNDVRRSLGVGLDEEVVLCVSALNQNKGRIVPPLIEACARVRKQHPQLRLVIVGDGPSRAAYESAAPPDVLFTGFRRDLGDMFAMADIFVGEGSAHQQAAAAGLPCIVTCGMTQPEHADKAFALFGLHLTDRYFFHSNAVVPLHSYDDAITLLLNDGELRARLSRVGRELILRHWNIDRMMSELLEFWAGNEMPPSAVGTSEAVLEIAGGRDDDVDFAAQALALVERPERFGVRARAPIAWARLAAMPLEHAQALTSASWRCVLSSGVEYRVSADGPPQTAPEHADLQRTWETMPLPPTQRTKGETASKAPAMLLLVLPGEEDDAAAFAGARSEEILAWMPQSREDDENSRALDEAWKSRRLRPPAKVHGLMPWTFVGRLFSLASAYADGGRPLLERYRSLARECGLPVRSFDVTETEERSR